jgi:hypothetical protein
MVDYVKLAIVAERLIRQNGRLVTFVRKDRTPSDPSKPWKGPVDGETTLALSAVFVPPNTVRQFGLSSLGEGTQFLDLVTFSEQVAIVFPEDNDLRQYQTIRDQGINWNMIGLQLLQPAATKLLAFVGTRR